MDDAQRSGFAILNRNWRQDLHNTLLTLLRMWQMGLETSLGNSLGTIRLPTAQTSDAQNNVLQRNPA
jgi:hypothetical protein